VGVAVGGSRRGRGRRVRVLPRGAWVRRGRRRGRGLPGTFPRAPRAAGG
jgi:hypothetical protein